MMSDIGLTLAKIGLSKPNIKLVIMSNHGKTGLMITAEVLAYEKDLLTGKILSALHPSILTRIVGFEKIERDFNGYFDVAASNVPFGDFAVADPAYAVSKEIAYRQATKTIHNYFFLKALDQVREAMIVTSICAPRQFVVILEDFYNLLRHRRFGRKSKNEVMIWQPYLFLRFAVSCFHCHSS